MCKSESRTQLSVESIKIQLLVCQLLKMFSIWVQQWTEVLLFLPFIQKMTCITESNLNYSAKKTELLFAPSG